MAGYLPGQRRGERSTALAATLAPRPPVVPIMFYRSALLAADTAPIDALCEALCGAWARARAAGVPSLKDQARERFRARCAAAARTGGHRHHHGVCRRRRRRGFGARRRRRAGAAGGDRHHAARGLAGEPARAWPGRSRHACRAARARRSRSGRARSLSRTRCRKTNLLGFAAFASRPEPDRIAQVADRIAAQARLASLPRAEKRVAVLMPDYPGAAGPDRLCRRSRRAGKHRRAPRRSRRRRLLRE